MRTRMHLSVVIFLGVLAMPLVLFAQDLSNVGDAAGLGGAGFLEIIGNIIRVILGLLGVVLLVLMIYSGILWMMAGGDGEKVEKAKQTMIRAVIGFVIVLMSFAFVTFIMNALGAGGLFGGDRERPGPSIPGLSNSLGNGGLIDHYPMRDQANVARNTRVIVTFKGVIDPEMLIASVNDSGTPDDISDDINYLDTDKVKIYRTDEGRGEAFSSTNVQVGYSIINTENTKTSTFVFIVPVLDGLAKHSVCLEESIRDSNGDVLIDGGGQVVEGCEGYLWSFNTSDQLDLTPPQVQRVVPVRDRTYGRNIAIQMTFNEAMDPTSVSGLFVPSEGGTFNNIVVAASGDVDPVEGVFMISNGYRTVSYLTNNECGRNSCGQAIFCLPANRDITTTIKSPDPLDVGQGSQVPATPYPPLGATDVVGNALDSNADGSVTADEPDYSWGFKTNNQIVLEGPEKETVQPTIREEEVLLDVPIEIGFDYTLLASSVIPGEAVLFKPFPVHDLWFVTRVRPSGEDEDKDIVEIPHGVLAESTEEQTYDYRLLGLEKIQNMYQNCFIPSAGPGEDAARCEPTVAEPYCCDGVLSANSCLPRL